MTDTASAAPSEREQFEAHATERGYKLARGPNDSYQYRDASVAWKAWQAARSQPTPPAVVEPLTDEQVKAALWTEHLRWMEAAGLDTEGMQPGNWLDHWLFYVRAIEAAHGIGIKKENGNA